MTSMNPGLIQPTLPSGLGLTESGIHPASGLRSFTHCGVFASDDTCVASANIATTTTWKVLPIVATAATDGPWGIYSQTTTPQLYTPRRTRLPFPCTPCITYRQTNATPANTQTFGVKIYGRDQFGTPIYEQVLNHVTADSTHTTGVPVAPAKRRTRVWCAKVFSVIERIEYIASCQGSSDYIDVGVHWDFDYLGGAAPYENYVGQANQGIGTVGFVNSYTPTQGNLYTPDLMGIELVNLDPQVFPIISGTNTNPAVYTLGPGPQGITDFSVANPTVVTVTTGFARTAGTKFRIRIMGDTEQPHLNGEWVATSISTTTFSIPVNVTAVHAGGYDAGGFAYMYAATPAAAVPIHMETPVLVSGLASANPATLGGYHEALFTSGYSFTVPLSATANGQAASSYVHILRQPVASVQAYAPAASLYSLARGGFRLGTNAAGFNGSPYKWNLYKSISGATFTPTAIAGTVNHGYPILPTDNNTSLSDNDGAVASLTHFPWTRGARVAFTAFYHSSYGLGKSGSSSSYGHAP